MSNIIISKKAFCLSNFTLAQLPITQIRSLSAYITSSFVIHTFKLSFYKDHGGGPLKAISRLSKKARKDLDVEDDFERFGERNHRLARKPSRRRSVKDLVSDEKTPGIKFDEPALQSLYENGHFDELLYQLKSGKEATVYVVSGENGLLAAKIYQDLQVRSFKNDSIYRAGRFIGDTRIEKAIKNRSKRGLATQQSLWVYEEFKQLEALHQAGVPVPKPIAFEGNVVLMEFIGDENGAAPRLSDVQLDLAKAKEAFEQSVKNLSLIVKSGRVHGDYSAFNILWWQERAIVIDFPQVVLFEANPSAIMILKRDVEGFCRSFYRFGFKPNPDKVWQIIQNTD